MTNGQKMRKLFEEKKLVVAPGCHDALTAKIISYLGFDAVYMTGTGCGWRSVPACSACR